MIYVFKTSVRTEHQVRALKPHIDQALAFGKWNFDLQDCDRILRIDGEEELVPKVIAVLQDHRFFCEELQ